MAGFQLFHYIVFKLLGAGECSVPVPGLHNSKSCLPYPLCGEKSNVHSDWVKSLACKTGLRTDVDARQSSLGQ